MLITPSSPPPSYCYVGYSLGGEAYWASGLHLYAPLPFVSNELLRRIRLHSFVTAGNLCRCRESLSLSLFSLSLSLSLSLSQTLPFAIPPLPPLPPRISFTAVRAGEEHPVVVWYGHSLQTGHSSDRAQLCTSHQSSARRSVGDSSRHYCLIQVVSLAHLLHLLARGFAHSISDAVVSCLP